MPPTDPRSPVDSSPGPDSGAPSGSTAIPPDALPVLPYTVVRGQLDHGDPGWLARVQAGLVMLAVSVAGTLLRGLIAAADAFRPSGGDSVAWELDAFLHNALYGVDLAAVFLLTSREPNANPGIRRPESGLAIAARSLILLAIVTVMVAHLRGTWPGSPVVYWLLMATSTASAIVATLVVSILVIGLARRLPNAVLERRWTACVWMLGFVWLTGMVVGYAPMMGWDRLSLQDNPAMQKVLAVAGVAVEAFAVAVLLPLAAAVGRAGDAARHHRPTDESTPVEVNAEVEGEPPGEPSRELR